MSQSYSPAAMSRTASGSNAALTPKAKAPSSSSEGDYFNQPRAINSPAGWTPGPKSREEIEKENQERLKDMEQHAQRFADGRDRLISSIDETSHVLTSLRGFGKERWIVHYPAIDRRAPVSQSPRQNLRRAQSVAPEGHHIAESDVSQGHGAQHPGLHRSNTEIVAQSAPNTPIKQQTYHNINESVSEAPIDGEEHNNSIVDDAEEGKDQSEMSVLRLDLKLGAAGNNPQALVRTLEKSSVAQLLDERMTSSIRQLDSLRDRISDRQSKVLVTGDLNAGKSTFVNALIRRKLMPVDQQPCTTVFCEVLDAEEANEGREEVHLVHPGMSYDVQNDNTYTRHTLEDIERIVADAEDVDPEDAPMIKCYCHDTRSTQESLLRNGIVDIALIDAPGLNRDSLKTTALFARQEQIDVVVFVVSAENHFTLSAKEFLWNASNDKAYIFIVVNKFDQIHNKEKCKRLVLEQIKQLSPRTYEDAEELVHFVDSDSAVDVSSRSVETPTEERKVAGDDESALKAPETSVSFTQLEACLRDFVLQRREKSKLLPAQTYLLRLLSDIEFLASTNLGVANAELEEARRQLELARPALEECRAAQSSMETELEGEEDGVVSDVTQRAQLDLDGAVDLIGEGKPASSTLSLPSYPGFFSALDYAADVRDTLIKSLDLAVSEAEQSARLAAQSAVTRIKELGESYLPSDVERSQRVFVPEMMFSKRLRRRNVGTVGLGLGTEIIQARITDIFDGPHYVSILTNAREAKDGQEGKSVSKHIEEDLGILSGVSLGVGALTLVGGKAYGAKSAIDAIVNLSNFFGNATVRKWGPTVVGLATAGFAVYLIQDLPHSIPRNIGRSMKRDLKALPRSSQRALTATSRRQSMDVASNVENDLNSTTISPEGDDNGSSLILNKMGIDATITFSEYHGKRLSREVRKVVRMAGWEVQSRLQQALHDRQQKVEELESSESKATHAIGWFQDTTGKVEVIRTNVEGVKIAQ
ncbi:unnamed protein product [Sympodiomycopsis kandeliae]